MYTNRVAMARPGSSRPVRGTNTEGAQLGGTKGYPSAAEATVDTRSNAWAWRDSSSRHAAARASVRRLHAAELQQ